MYFPKGETSVTQLHSLILIEDPLYENIVTSQPTPFVVNDVSPSLHENSLTGLSE